MLLKRYEECNDRIKLMLQGCFVEQCIKDFASYFEPYFIKQSILDPNILGIKSSDVPEEIVNAYTSEQLEAGFEYLSIL